MQTSRPMSPMPCNYNADMVLVRCGSINSSWSDDNSTVYRVYRSQTDSMLWLPWSSVSCLLYQYNFETKWLKGNLRTEPGRNKSHTIGLKKRATMHAGAYPISTLMLKAPFEMIMAAWMELFAMRRTHKNNAIGPTQVARGRFAFSAVVRKTVIESWSRRNAKTNWRIRATQGTIRAP